MECLHEHYAYSDYVKTCTMCGKTEMCNNEYVAVSDTGYMPYNVSINTKHNDILNYLNTLLPDENVLKQLFLQQYTTMLKLENYKGAKQHIIIRYLLFTLCCEQNAECSVLYKLVDNFAISHYARAQHIINSLKTKGLLASNHAEYDEQYYAYYCGKLFSKDASECELCYKQYMAHATKIPLQHTIKNIIISMYVKFYNVAESQVSAEISTVTLKKILDDMQKYKIDLKELSTQYKLPIMDISTASAPKKPHHPRPAQINGKAIASALYTECSQIAQKICENFSDCFDATKFTDQYETYAECVRPPTKKRTYKTTKTAKTAKTATTATAAPDKQECTETVKKLITFSQQNQAMFKELITMFLDEVKMYLNTSAYGYGSPEQIHAEVLEKTSKMPEYKLLPILMHVISPTTTNKSSVFTTMLTENIRSTKYDRVVQTAVYAHLIEVFNLFVAAFCSQLTIEKIIEGKAQSNAKSFKKYMLFNTINMPPEIAARVTSCLQKLSECEEKKATTPVAATAVASSTA